MRLIAAGVSSACLSLVVVLTARASDPVVAVLAVAGVVAALATLAARAGRDGLSVVDPLWTLVLLLRGRVDVWSLLPLWAAQTVGALGGGLAAGFLADDLPVLSLTQEPPAAALAALCGLAGLLTGWLVPAASDGSAPVATTALPTVVAAVVLPLSAAGGAAVGPLFAGGVAGAVDWSDLFVAALALAAGAVVGALTVRIFPVDGD